MAEKRVKGVPLEDEQEDECDVDGDVDNTDQIPESVVPFIRAREAYENDGSVDLIIRETDLAIAGLSTLIAKNEPPPPPQPPRPSSTASNPLMPPPPSRRLPIAESLPKIPAPVDFENKKNTKVKKEKKKRKSRAKMDADDVVDEKLEWSFSPSGMF